MSENKRNLLFEIALNVFVMGGAAAMFALLVYAFVNAAILNGEWSQ